MNESVGVAPRFAVYGNFALGGVDGVAGSLQRSLQSARQPAQVLIAERIKMFASAKGGDDINDLGQSITNAHVL